MYQQMDTKALYNWPFNLYLYYWGAVFNACTVMIACKIKTLSSPALLNLEMYALMKID